MNNMKQRLFHLAIAGISLSSTFSHPVPAADKVDFVKQIQPLLEFKCVTCHREGYAKGGLRLDVKAEAFKPGDSGVSIVPGNAQKSSSYTRTLLPNDNDEVMPPKAKDIRLTKAETEALRDWINQGANWPEGLVLVGKKVDQLAVGNDPTTMGEIHQKLVANLKEKSPADMKAYTGKIPGTDITFDMLPIPAGTFMIGSPEGEAGHKPDEGPQRKVKIEPFWMGKYEVTWNEYELFMYPVDGYKNPLLSGGKLSSDNVADAVTRPTKPYVEMSFGMGKDGFPAISMTQHGANTYCKWLSAKTGHFYRLPTEAEWEYACRAGTTTAYSFGDDASKLGEYAWYGKNSDFKYQKVGKKKPNPWGLHDMHGNVTEWTLDQYAPESYKNFVGATVASPWVQATKPYPHVARGGSWDDDDVKVLRSSARRASNKTWKIQDPQLPKSIWYLTDAQFLGFRVIRPLKVPSAEELSKYWTSGVEKD